MRLQRPQLPRRQELDADGLQPEDRALLRALATNGAWTSGTSRSAYKKGAAYLGAGFTIKPLFEDHIGVLRAIDPATGKIKFGVNNHAPLWGGVMTTSPGLRFFETPLCR